MSVQLTEDRPNNIDHRVVAGFGDEWSRFDQRPVAADEKERTFAGYFRVFPWDELPKDGGVGADVGCGSGRWAAFVAPRVAKLHLVDPSPDALSVARQNLAALSNVEFHQASVDAIPLPDASLDFAYSLGVLHHVPDTAQAIKSVVAKLKPGAPLQLYLYYALDNRSPWFRALWRASALARFAICRMPGPARHAVADTIAAVVYYPLAKSAKWLDRAGVMPPDWPLAFYRDKSFYTMRTDALDRFGTRLEQRFRRDQIAQMMLDAGLDRIVFSEDAPYWCVVGRKR